MLCADSAACTLLEAGTAEQLADRVLDWFDPEALARATSEGSFELKREYSGVDPRKARLSVRLRPFVAAASTATRFIAQIEPAGRANTDFPERRREIDHAYARLRSAEAKLLQSDKMASIGQLAAGVAHEINNPIGYIYSNLGTLGEYINNLFRVIGVYDKGLRGVDAESNERRNEVAEVKQQIDFDFLVKDLPMLLSESREGIERVRKIVENLRDFSRAGYAEEWTMADLHRGLDSTLNIVWNDLKYKCDVQRNYGDIPQIECLPSQLNQVFLNILVNAGHAIENRGTIGIATGKEGENVFVEISDTGKGIPQESLERIFDPFFTTKPVGQGTGLGLSLSYSIVRKHGGRIEVQSKVGEGTKFRVVLPMHHQHETAAAINQSDHAPDQHDRPVRGTT
ncbi:MAG: ATP-binding protein [Rudaea sp.]|nr:ATP-binding protein [Rudaea sp.]